MLNLEETINREFLQGRYLALELAALLDRLDEAAARSQPRSADERRLIPLRQAIAILAAPSAAPDRAERILRLYTEAQS